MITIGKVVKAHGLKGDVKVYPYTEDNQRFDNLTTIYIEGKPFTIKGVKHQKNMVLLKLAGINVIEETMPLINKEIQMSRDELEPLGEDEHLIVDLIGYQVIDEDGQEIGSLVDIETNTPQALYVVKTPLGLKYIPGVKAFIRAIDKQQKTVTVRLIEGL